MTMGGIGSGGATGSDVDLTTGGDTTGNTGSSYGSTTGSTGSSYAGGPTTTSPAGDPAMQRFDADPLLDYGAATPSDRDPMLDAAGDAGVYAAGVAGSGATGGGSTGGASTGDTIRDQAQNLREQAVGKVRSAADEGKAQVADTLDGVAEAAREFAQRLEGQNFGPVGGYAKQLADTLDNWAHAVRDKPVDDWLDDGRELIRRSPVVAAGVAVAAGFVLSRFLRASGGATQRYTA